MNLNPEGSDFALVAVQIAKIFGVLLVLVAVYRFS